MDWNELDSKAEQIEKEHKCTCKQEIEQYKSEIEKLNSILDEIDEIVDENAQVPQYAGLCHSIRLMLLKRN